MAVEKWQRWFRYVLGVWCGWGHAFLGGISLERCRGKWAMMWPVSAILKHKMSRYQPREPIKSDLESQFCLTAHRENIGIVILNVGQLCIR